jgi:hypothetical protein
MFVGHIAVAFGAKRVAPSVSLGWLVAAVTLLDLLWPPLLLLGVEHVSIVPGATAFTPLVFDSYPWSHSLLMAGIWGGVLAAIGRWCRLPVSAWLLAALVVSHWLLDFLTHAPDLPLWPGASPRVGLGLWNSVPASFAVEGAMWAIGIFLYLRGRSATRWSGRVALWSFIAICTGLWIAGALGPPPPSARAIAWFGLSGWLLPPWAAVADRSYATTLAS